MAAERPQAIKEKGGNAGPPNRAEGYNLQPRAGSASAFTATDRNSL